MTKLSSKTQERLRQKELDETKTAIITVYKVLRNRKSGITLEMINAKSPVYISPALIRSMVNVGIEIQIIQGHSDSYKWNGKIKIDDANLEMVMEVRNGLREIFDFRTETNPTIHEKFNLSNLFTGEGSIWVDIQEIFPYDSNRIVVSIPCDGLPHESDLERLREVFEDFRTAFLTLNS